MPKTIIALLVLVMGLLSCRSNNSRQQQQAAQSSSDSLILITTGTQLVPAFSSVDSLLFMFYHDPYGKDSTRYTRYYRQIGSADSSVTSVLMDILATPFREDSLRACRSEGKLYCFAKGRPVQTIYFSRQNDQCLHLYFIHEARYYYFKPNNAWYALLDSMKPKAQEPKAVQ